jgi:SOS-response transcriptional repressor LexA
MKPKRKASSNVLAFPSSAPATPISREGMYQVDMNEFLIGDPENTIGISVVGDTTQDHGIQAGDFLIVNTKLTPAPGDIVLTRDDDEDLRIRLVHSLGEARAFGSWGVVVHVIRTLRQDSMRRRKGGAR